MVKHREKLLAKREEEVKLAMHEVKVEQEKQRITGKSLEESLKKAKEQKEDDLVRNSNKVAQQVQDGNSSLHEKLSDAESENKELASRLRELREDFNHLKVKLKSSKYEASELRQQLSLQLDSKQFMSEQNSEAIKDLNTRLEEEQHRNNE